MCLLILMNAFDFFAADAAILCRRSAPASPRRRQSSGRRIFINIYRLGNWMENGQYTYRKPAIGHILIRQNGSLRRSAHDPFLWPVVISLSIIGGTPTLLYRRDYGGKFKIVICTFV